MFRESEGLWSGNTEPQFFQPPLQLRTRSRSEEAPPAFHRDVHSPRGRVLRLRSIDLVRFPPNTPPQPVSLNAFSKSLQLSCSVSLFCRFQSCVAVSEDRVSAPGRVLAAFSRQPQAMHSRKLLEAQLPGGWGGGRAPPTNERPRTQGLASSQAKGQGSGSWLLARRKVLSIFSF